MGKKKPTASRGRPPKHAGDPDQSGRTGSPLSLRIDPKLRELANAFIAVYKQKNDVRLYLTDVIELALTRLYRDYGVLPPSSET